MLFLLIFSLVQVASYYFLENSFQTEHLPLYKIQGFSYFISILIFVNGVIYLGLKYPENISDISYLKKRIRSITDGKYKYSSLGQTEAHDIINKVMTNLKQDALYKNPSLTVESISNMIGESPQNVSQSLNQYVGKNFNECVSDLRLLEASHLLQQTDEKPLIIKEIMYEVGFNSKSNFNSLFKKKFGSTPKQYRDNYYETKDVLRGSAT